MRSEELSIEFAHKRCHKPDGCGHRCKYVTDGIGCLCYPNREEVDFYKRGKCYCEGCKGK